MSLPSARQTLRQLSPRRVLLTALALALVATAGGAFVLDHPAAQAGFGQRDWSSFETVTGGDRAYTVAVTHAGGAESSGLTVRHTRYANGSFVETVVPTGAASTLPDGTLSRRSVVHLGDVRYERTTYARGRPSTLEPHVYVDDEGRVVDRREDAAGSVGGSYAEGVERLLAGQVSVAAGTVTRNGTTFARYDVLGDRDAVERLTASESVTGHLLVDDAGRVRYAELRSGDAVVEYRATPGARRSVPSWVATARAKLDPPMSVPDVRAYRRNGTVVLLSPAQWTPDETATLALLADGGPLATVRLPAGDPVFERRENDTYVAVVTPTRSGAALSTDRPDGRGDWARAPERLVVDRTGRNLHDAPVEPGSRLGSVYSVVAAHLRPRNGGGRVLRVDDLQFGEHAGPDTSVTLTVGNGTAARSLTVRARDLSTERFYLLRTADGLEVRNAGGIATHVTPSTRFANRRFVADARFRVRAGGVVVVERPVPERVTQAGPRPLPALLTGVGIRTYDEPPDRALLGRGPELRAMNWTGDTFVTVHSWDYDRLRVGGGVDALHSGALREDETHYYRASDGTTVWVETANGTRLYRGTANGSAVVSP